MTAPNPLIAPLLAPMIAPLIAITPGEPAGIGPECLLRLAANAPGGQELLAVADPVLLNTTARALGLDLVVRAWQPGQPLPEGALACLPVQLPRSVRAGHPDPANAPYVLECLRQAVNLLGSGTAAALVTGPVHKAVINEAGIPFSGHTEFLAELAGVERVVMLLTSPGLRVALVTTHLPLREVPDAINREVVAETIRITHRDLQQRFGIARPRLAVLGLNPHAGESGHLGHEEQDHIEPAIAACRAEGLDAFGPVPADSAFTHKALQGCDVVIAMYHDQGLPVLKHAGFGESVNVTLGLPFIRTSVDHGTALDIAGRALADPASLGAAVRLATQLAAGSTGPERSAADRTD